MKEERKVLVAMDQFGGIKPVSDLNKNDRGKWFCIECGENLTARLGDKRRYHWAHNPDSKSICGGGESEMHKIAKDIIRENISKCTFFKKCLKIIMCDGKCDERHKSGLGDVKRERPWKGAEWYEISKQYDFQTFEDLQAVLEDRSLLHDIGMIPDVLLYRHGEPVGVIEVEHTNPKNKEEIDKFRSRFDGFFFELKAKDIIEGNIKNMKKEFSSYHRPVELCYQCKQNQVPYHCFTL
tara:strand:+ start:150 stop:863 length:714 start_codon:yes stop_codon:yes gene_type:complete